MAGQIPIEILTTTLVTLFTGVIWVPIILNRLAEMGCGRH